MICWLYSRWNVLEFFIGFYDIELWSRLSLKSFSLFTLPKKSLIMQSSNIFLHVVLVHKQRVQM